MIGTQVVGYLHILVESIQLDDIQNPIHAHITFGEIAKVDTTPQPSGTILNQVFLIQVPKEPARFVVNCYEGEKAMGDCRYDIRPFMERDGITHTIDSELLDEQNKKVGFAKMKLAFHSSRWGKLKVRIFHLEFHQETIDKFKEAKVRVICGIHAHSTQVRPLSKPFDQTVEVLVLKPTNSLSFQVVHEKGVLASYTIKNIQQAGVLCQQSKAYQVSLFNHDKPIGFIKYQIAWIK